MRFSRNNPAFTMFEILVVVMIIGIILAFALPRMGRWFSTASTTQVKLKMTSVQSALQEYFFELGSFPSSREGLKALLENPRPNDERYRKVAATGKWPFMQGGEDAISDNNGREFVYNAPPQKFKGKYKYYELIWHGSSGEENDPETIEMGA